MESKIASKRFHAPQHSYNCQFPIQILYVHCMQIVAKTCFHPLCYPWVPKFSLRLFLCSAL